jgi:hypothetical protein
MEHGHVYYLTRDGSDRKSVEVNWASRFSTAEKGASQQQYNLLF